MVFPVSWSFEWNTFSYGTVQVKVICSACDLSSVDWEVISSQKCWSAMERQWASPMFHSIGWKSWKGRGLLIIQNKSIFLLLEYDMGLC